MDRRRSIGAALAIIAPVLVITGFFLVKSLLNSDRPGRADTELAAPDVRSNGEDKTSINGSENIPANYIPFGEQATSSMNAETAHGVGENPEEEEVSQEVVFELLSVEAMDPSNIEYDHQRLPADSRSETISQVFPARYTELEGVLTFRGGPYRDSPSYGIASPVNFTLSPAWSFTTPSKSSWGGGGGWTGQPAVVRWPEELRAIMNLYPEYKDKEGFTEIICASLNGTVYFFDLETGAPSRKPIDIGNPIKGSISIDPRGYPILYVGDGIADKKNFGFRLFSLLDGTQLLFVNGRDGFAHRSWGAFDASAIFNPETDTLFVCGENGIFYKIILNTAFDPDKGYISLDPIYYKYRYKIKGNRYQGIENSPAVYHHYAYFADNGGWIQCVDLNTMTPMWTFNNTDDTDATITLAIEEGTPYLYTGCEVDHQGTKGYAYVRKINGLTGEQVWENEYPCMSILGDKPNNGGVLATNVIGKNAINDRVIFTIARYREMWKGLLVALSKETGEELWRLPLTHYAWSSPVDFYDKDGRGYLIQCNYAGNMLLIDGESGTVLDQINLGANIEASPVVFEDWIVVSTRGNRIYGIEIQ